MHFGLFSDLEPKDLWGKKKKKLRRRRWQSRGYVKLEQQGSNPAQIANHGLHLRLLLLFLLLSSFSPSSPSSLSSLHLHCCGFSPSLCFFFFLYSFLCFESLFTWLALGRKKIFYFWIKDGNFEPMMWLILIDWYVTNKIL